MKFKCLYKVLRDYFHLRFGFSRGGCFLPSVFSGNFPARAAYQVASLPRVSAKETIPSRGKSRSNPDLNLNLNLNPTPPP